MSQVLELAQLVDEYSVSEMQVRRGWVEARLYAQRATLGQLPEEIGFEQDLRRTAAQLRELFFGAQHGVA